MNVKEGDRIRIVSPRERWPGVKYRDSRKVCRVESVCDGKAWVHNGGMALCTDGFYPDEYEIVSSRRNDIINRIIHRLERMKR